MAPEEEKVHESALLSACNQLYPIDMEQLFTEVHLLTKIGEGIFGEVYEGRVALHGDQLEEEQSFRTVFKVVPIQGEEKVNGERQKRYEEVLPEVIISKKMTSLSENQTHNSKGFIKLYKACVTVGSYPQKLISAWDDYENENNSDNDRPTHFPLHQRYLVFIYEHGGYDAGHYKFKSAQQVLFLVLQTVHALAVAEMAFEFEHRDMHGNNVLVKETSKPNIELMINGTTRTIPTFGVISTIIDFTLSRIKLEGQEGSESKAIFLDMADDEEMFLSRGDYQFDIYRMMRDANRNNWEGFVPKTNVMWVHYFIDKLLRRLDPPADTDYLRKLRLLKHRMLHFTSCLHFVTSDLCAALLHDTISKDEEPINIEVSINGDQSPAKLLKYQKEESK